MCAHACEDTEKWDKKVITEGKETFIIQSDKLK